MSNSTTPSATTTTPNPHDFCRTTEWYILLAASVGSYAVGLVVVLVLNALCRESDAKQQQQEKRTAKRKPSLLTRLHLFCQALAKGANVFGKVLLILYTVCVVVSIIVYIFLTYQFTDVQPVGSRTLLKCFRADQHPLVYVEFGLNVFYCLMLVLRLMSSDSLLSFWLTIDTFADLLTIIPSFIMFGLDRYLIAFQFARLTGLRFLVNTLIYCRVLSADKYIRLVSLVIHIFSIWVFSAGLFQLIEVVGDFWRHDEGATSGAFYQFHDCVYFLLITMSTVGYGDISPKTIIGKLFIIVFICIALGLFTSIIPEVSDILSENKKYRKNHVHLKQGKKHVVVIAKFTPSLLKTFLSDFFHSERDLDEKQFLALLGREEPDLELKTLMKTRELYVTYLQGSVMSVRDLQRACVGEASAVIVLSNSQAKDMEDEDMRNIMRVIAIKDFCPTVQVLVQLQLYRSKTYLRNIPDWNTDRGDEAVCINEIKYGILAQSCQVPGLSTLLCNLLMLRSGLGAELAPFSWESAYLHGVEYEFYRVPFSNHFHGFTFQQAAEVCVDQLSITLLAVEVVEGMSRRTVINPGADLRINSDTMQAFVIASDEREAKLASRFQPKQQAQNSLLQFLTSCCCSSECSCCYDSLQEAQLHAVTSVSADSLDTCDTVVSHVQHYGKTVVEINLNDVTLKDQQMNNHGQSRSSSNLAQTTTDRSDSQEMLLDSSGYFHWAPNHSIEEVTLDPMRRHNFSGHVIVCILEKSPKLCLNLTSFLMPLRSSSIPSERVKDVIFVGKVELLKSEWHVMQNFPKVHILNGSPLNRANLKAISIESCHSCLIMSPKTVDFEPDAQMDRETVLCTLNIKTMKHSSTGALLGDSIHIITELNNEDAIAYLDQDDEMEVDEAYKTQAFATGRTFFLSLLESLVTTIYFNPAALSFLRTIVTTVDSDDFEVDLNEQGFMFLGSDHSHGEDNCQIAGLSQQRSQIELLPVSGSMLQPIFNAKAAMHWKDFTLRCLRQLELVCIGLSRLQVESADAKNHRFVMTMPHDSVVVKETDWVYCLTPPKTNR